MLTILLTITKSRPAEFAFSHCTLIMKLQSVLDSRAKPYILSFQVEIYRGIPFAAPPVGSLRFMPPVTVTPWREIRSATHFGPVCPQLLPETRHETAAMFKMSQGRLQAIRDMKPLLANQTEDCLYLNVYSPRSQTNSGKKTTRQKMGTSAEKNNQQNLAALKHTWPLPKKSPLLLYTRKATQLKNIQKLRFHVLFTSQLGCLSGVERQGGFSRMWPGMFQSSQVF